MPRGVRALRVCEMRHDASESYNAANIHVGVGSCVQITDAFLAIFRPSCMGIRKSFVSFFECYFFI